MKCYGLTGGIGMGKSTAAEWLRSRGAAVVDTDDIARQLVQPREAALAEISVVFGESVLGPDGQLRRDELARIVFDDPEARRRLEAILHPRIRERWLAQVEVCRERGEALVVVVVPLLFETEAERFFEKTICVACSAATQRRRLRARGWTGEQIERRNAAQWPVERKMHRADFVVWTEGGLDALAGQLARILPERMAK